MTRVSEIEILFKNKTNNGTGSVERLAKMNRNGSATLSLVRRQSSHRLKYLGHQVNSHIVQTSPYPLTPTWSNAGSASEIDRLTFLPRRESRKVSGVALGAGGVRSNLSIHEMGELGGLVVQLVVGHELVQLILFAAGVVMVGAETAVAGDF